MRILKIKRGSRKSSKWRGVFQIIEILTFFSAPLVLANSFEPLSRGVRAQAMGNAFTAVADDEEAIFYNPAGLAGINRFSLQLVSASLEASDDLLAQISTVKAMLGNPSLSSLNQLMGSNIYARGTVGLNLVMPGFGISLFGDQQAAIQLQNPSLPQMLITGQTTYGGQLALGFTMLKLKKSKGELRFGVGAKMLWRGGGDQTLSLGQLMTTDLSGIGKNLTQIGQGIGVDTGLQFIYNLKKGVSLQTGIAFTDMGDTTFTTSSDPQKSNITTGMALKIKSSDMTAIAAFDYSHLLDNVDFRKKTHLGLELKFPVLSLDVGLSEMNLSYGATVDLLIVKIQYASYIEEMSPIIGINPEHRNLLRAFIKFDI